MDSQGLKVYQEGFAKIQPSISTFNDASSAVKVLVKVGVVVGDSWALRG